jgi:hypothetical protein
MINKNYNKRRPDFLKRCIWCGGSTLKQNIEGCCSQECCDKRLKSIEEWKAKGFCVWCGNPKVIPGYKVCNACNDSLHETFDYIKGLEDEIKNGR